MTPAASARHCDVAIVGAGIIGLAHAYAVARRGRRVTVFERDLAANGASIRNFGLGLCVGQAPGLMHELALASRPVWREVLAASGAWHKAGGSLIVARNAAELAVLEEFQGLRGQDFGTRMATAAEVASAGASGLAALASPWELALESRRALPALAAWLAATHGVHFEWGCHVHHVAPPYVETSRGPWRAERVIVAGGHDFCTLYAADFAGRGLQQCALQMLRLGVPDGSPALDLQPALMTGLSCLHYPAFAGLPGLAAVRAQVAAEAPKLLDHGIHLIIQQVGASGELIVGDSHHYGDTPPPFQSAEVDSLLQGLAEDLLQRPLEVRERWQGLYASGPRPFEVFSPVPGVTVVAITSGVGMSIGFALADRIIADDGHRHGDHAMLAAFDAPAPPG